LVPLLPSFPIASRVGGGQGCREEDGDAKESGDGERRAGMGREERGRDEEDEGGERLTEGGAAAGRIQFVREASSLARQERSGTRVSDQIPRVSELAPSETR
jgi:hypothetical protein